MIEKLKFFHSPDDKRRTTDSLVETTIKSPHVVTHQVSFITDDCFHSLNNKRINLNLVQSLAGTAIVRVLRGLVTRRLSKSFWKLGQFPLRMNKLAYLLRILELKTKNKKFEAFKLIDLTSKYRSEFRKLQSIRVATMLRVLTKAAFSQGFCAIQRGQRIKYLKHTKHLARVLQVILSVLKFKVFLQLQSFDVWQKSFTPIDISPIPSYSRSQIVAQGFQALSYIEEVTFNPKLKEHGFFMIKEFRKLTPKTKYFLFKTMQNIEGNLNWVVEEAFAMWKRRRKVIWVLDTPANIHHYVDDALKVSLASPGVVFRYAS